MKENALDNKCPNCSGLVTFDILKQLWHCDYCGGNYRLDELSDESGNASTIESNKVRETLEVSEYVCKNCGAKVLTDENTTSTFCVYCGNVTILKNKLTGVYAPDYIIPFKNTKEEIIVNFKKLQKGRPLMPKFFNDPKNIEKITGLYVPFWLFDVLVQGTAEFRGTKISTWISGDYRYTKTDVYKLDRFANISFDRVPSDGSKRFDNKLMESLEPFDYNKFEKYNHAYLAGFLAEKYDVNDQKALKIALERAKNSTINEMRNTCIGFNSIRLNDSNLTNIVKETDYVLLPVWMVNVKYKDKYYTFAMNGQTGKMVGNIPVHIGKAILMWVIVFVVTFGLLTLTWVVFK